MSGIDDELFKRLVLINQYTILSHVDPEQRDMWERSAAKVRNHWPIDDLPQVDWIMEASRDPFTEADRSFIIDVFAMYEALQHAENEKVVSPASPADFAGFDGNHETKYMSYARSLVDGDGKWTYLRRSNKDFNAHHHTLEIYERMLDEWGSHGKPFELTAAQYDALIAARVHSSNRA